MTDTERNLYLDLGWFAPCGDEIAGIVCRPLSLMSYQAVRLMGLRLLEREAVMSEPELMSEMTTWVWLHSAPIREVSDALWTGDWRAQMEAEGDVLPGLLSDFLEHRDRLRLMVEASGVKILPRPRSEHDKTPSHVVGPRDLAFTIAAIARDCSEPIEWIKWEMPLQQAMQFYHAGLRWQGAWTARIGESVDPADFEEFGVGDLGDAWTPPTAEDLAAFDGKG